MLTREEEALDILTKLGYQKFDSRDYISAIIYFERYISINQKNPVIYNTLGYLYKELSKEENINLQIEFFEKAIELDSNYICAIRNLALTYPLVGKHEEAVECFQKLFKLGPVMDDYLAYAFLQIQLKNFEEGWKYYKYRFIRENCIGYPKMKRPEWTGEDISNKTLLVHYEQGFGDTIMFFRYLEQVKPLAKKIIFRVQNELLDLIKLNLANVEVIGMSTPLEKLKFDYHIPLLSLLDVLRSEVDNIPLTKGYIKAEKKKVNFYKKEFFNNDCLKIGISWNGAKFGNRLRNVPLECFYPLAKLKDKDIKVYSFQKGFGAEQLEELPKDVEIVNLGATFENFSDTAAAMKNIDLFVTSDNCLFNLAGAMGAKTFVLLNKNAEWRWFLDEDKTPWYDSVKIFKKEKDIDDWDNLMSKVVKNII